MLEGSIGNGIKLKSITDWEFNDKYKFAVGTNESNFSAYDDFIDDLYGSLEEEQEGGKTHKKKKSKTHKKKKSKKSNKKKKSKTHKR